MIEIKHLRKKYARGKEVITDLNLSFGEVGLNIIVGKSGCGKTTLINILGGMDLDYEGIVNVDNKELRKLNYTGIADYRNFTSAFVFQKNSLFEFLTVEENLKLCLSIQNNESNISEALARVGLAGFEKKKVKALSGGEKQRVAIARALIKDCKIIFADEPTSALDSKNAHRIFQLFKELSKDKLVVLVTHDVKKASMYADRMVRLVDGFVEEDIVYNERTEKARELVEKKSQPFSMMPIFKYNLKTGMVINIFVLLILVVGFVILNITSSQKKVKEEYDFYGTTQQVAYNVDRALKTQVDNEINLFDIVKNGEATTPYYYIENEVVGDKQLDEADLTILSNTLEKYDVYQGAVDQGYKNLIIEKLSKVSKTSTKVNDISVYWKTYTPTTYTYYVYDENNDYNLSYGRLPEADNEILITDTVAQFYLLRRAKDPGEALASQIDKYTNNAYVDISEMLDETYDAETLNPNAKTYNDGYEDYDVTDGVVTLPNDFVIFDSYATIVGTIGSTLTYYRYNRLKYKVVGIIDTGLLNYYTYDTDAEKYYLLSDFKTQSGKDTYMNSSNFQPMGYVVLPESLPGRTENHDYNDEFDIVSTMVNDKAFSSTVAAFANDYDYTQKGISGAGNDDDLRKDLKARLVVTSTTASSLKDDEIILSVNAINKIYNRSFTNSSAKTFFDTIKNTKINVTFVTNTKTITKEMKIVGIARKSSADYYVSYGLYDELYLAQNPAISPLTINLDGVNYKQRKALMEKLFNLGYSLNPIDIMPGAYLEFVEGKGEMLASVDYDGLKSLYPNGEEVTIDRNKYFYVDGENFGQIDGEYVYMKSSLIRNISLDESYYSTDGNLSPYYLYSQYYNDDEAQTGNSILEVLDSLSTFFLAVAVILAIGFIYLKEFKQRESITKLSMLGVRNKDLITLSILTYIPMMIIIGVLSITVTFLFTLIINNLYSYGFSMDYIFNGNIITQSCDINRIRLMFDMSSVYTSIIASLIIGVILLVSSIIITLKSRK